MYRTSAYWIEPCLQWNSDSSWPPLKIEAPGSKETKAPPPTPLPNSPSSMNIEIRVLKRMEYETDIL